MAAQLPEDDEARAWADVLGRWGDEAAHRAFLDRFRDLDGLARAGGRYRDVLAARPDDGVAVRWRDEVVRRATAAGLASLPRTPPGVPQISRWVRPTLIGFLALLVVVCGALLYRTLTTSWGRP